MEVIDVDALPDVEDTFTDSGIQYMLFAPPCYVVNADTVMSLS